MQVEEPFRKISNSVTTRGNVFRVVFVGQSIKDQRDDSGQLGQVEKSSEIAGEYLAEAWIERQADFGPPTLVGTSTVIKTRDANFKVVAQRPIIE